MKGDPSPSAAKNPRDRFFDVGRKIMTTPKAEVEARDKAWHTERAKKRKHAK